MAVLFIGQLRFKDRERFRLYEEAFPALFDKTNGKVIAVDDAPKVMTGVWPYDRMVVLEFPTQDEAEAFFSSPAYKAIAVDRDAGAELTAVIVPRYDGPVGK
ncbi:MAG: DUF1330 domain-containing protein [Pseudomonadota bacterium]